MKAKYYGWSVMKYTDIFEKFIDSVWSLINKKPIIRENTFIVWEPCSKSHGEVVPGYVKYLLDMGYHVSVCINPVQYKEGLFSRFENENISYNKLSKQQIKKFFKNNDLKDVKGVLVTTAAKLCDETDFEECYKSFNEKADKSKIFFVVHEAKPSVDEGKWKNNLITLRELDYKGAKSVVINPHYFGVVNSKDKRNDIVNFISVGALRAKVDNANMIVDAVNKLHNAGITNFKVTVVGKGHIKDLPKELRKYFDIKGRLDFKDMYDEIEKADYILTSYDDKNEKHRRYITTGTSGTFQLSYGFNKPIIIIRSFADINGLDEGNSIFYNSPDYYDEAMHRAISMSDDEYKLLKENLKKRSDYVYNKSLNNFKELING